MPESLKLTKTEGKYSGSNAQLRVKKTCPALLSKAEKYMT